MRHPNLAALRDFALDGAGHRGSRTVGHLERCQDCRSTVLGMRRIVALIREDAMHPAPPGALDRILARRAAGNRVILADGEEGDARRSGSGRRSARWAVAILLGASVVAAAMSDTPVRRWIAERLIQPIVASAPRPVTPTTPTTSRTPVPSDTSVSGVAILAADSLWVSVDSVRGPVRIVLRMSMQPELEVHGIESASRATYRPRVRSIRVSDVTGGTLFVDVPGVARAFELRVGERVYARKAGRGFSVRTRADTVGADIIFDVRP